MHQLPSEGQNYELFVIEKPKTALVKEIYDQAGV